MKQKILEKSKELFLNLGFKSVTMDEIANALGVSKKTIYKYFTNKTSLVDAVTGFMFDTICNSIDEICARKLNPIDELFFIKRAVLDHLNDVATNQKFDKTTRFRITYKLLKATKNYKYFKPCFKHYLTKHIGSNVMKVNASEWNIAIFLQTASFKKASTSKVWSDSRSQY